MFILEILCYIYCIALILNIVLMIKSILKDIKYMKERRENGNKKQSNNIS